MVKNQLTLEEANHHFAYDSGILFWKTQTRGHKINSIAGNIDSKGYCRIGLNGKKFYRHNLIWNMFNDIIPDGKLIDHIKQKSIGGDDTIENLRIVSYSENSQNRIVKNNSGHMNIYFFGHLPKPWQMNIRNNIVKEQKYFKTLEEAIVYRDFIRKKFGMMELK